MKKKVLVSAIFISAVFASSVFAFQPKSEDYVIIPDPADKQEKISVPIQPIEQAKTYKKIVKSSDYVIMEDSQPIGKQEIQNAVEVVGKIGQNFKIKQSGKYGVIDKNGNMILAPVFQSVEIVTQNGQEYFKAKADGVYRYYYNTGNLVPEKDINSYTQNTSLLLARDLNPIFKAQIANKVVLYTKVEKKQPADSLVYEIKEIPIVKVSNGQVVNFGKSIQNIPSIENIPNNKQFDKNQVVANFDDAANYFTVGKTQYRLIKENGKLGISDIDGISIIPVKFDTIDIIKPCKHFKTPVFLTSLNKSYAIYDEKGSILAEQNYDKINVYKNGKLYTYSLEDGIGILKADGKKIGTFVPTQKGVYKYQPKNKFSFRKPHIVNSLIITILNI